jgi:hypothetical protein
VPPSGGSPKRDDDRSFGFFGHNLSPFFSDKMKRSINPTIELDAIVTESITENTEKHTLTHESPPNQCKEKKMAQRLFSLEEKRSKV